MKAKLVLTAVMMALCAGSYAQDIIHTFDGKSIEAKILEISDDSILYKTFDNQDGPDYRMSVGKVSRIVFANGTEKVFAPADIFSASTLISGYSTPYDYYGIYGPLEYRNGHYYDRRGPIREDRIRDYLGVSLYGSDYLKAKKQLAGGILLTTSGVGGLVMAAIGGMAAANAPEEFQMTPGIFALAAGIAGVACLGVGIPLWVKGDRKMNAMADDYNQRFGAGKANLSLGSAPSGLGLTLNF
ncbi:MAG: hypothetical protein J5668_01495 [Bacteroidales bacterium]|nr:hypothetical protein [Bacteroidales bacterium]